MNHFAHDIVTSTKRLIMIDQSSIKMKQDIFHEKTYSDRSKKHGCRRKKVKPLALLGLESGLPPNAVTHLSDSRDIKLDAERVH